MKPENEHQHWRKSGVLFLFFEGTTCVPNPPVLRLIWNNFLGEPVCTRWAMLEWSHFPGIFPGYKIPEDVRARERPRNNFIITVYFYQDWRSGYYKLVLLSLYDGCRQEGDDRSQIRTSRNRLKRQGTKPLPWSILSLTTLFCQCRRIKDKRTINS